MPSGSMSDPLMEFDWTTLHVRYDRMSKGFDPGSRHLRRFRTGAASDRLLYYELVDQAAPGTRFQLDEDWYEALLYWKLYSQPSSDSNITKWMTDFPLEDLRRLLASVPKTLERRASDIIDLLDLIGDYHIPGMKLSSSLPVRTTFLHTLYPNVVPVFDKMVLLAVGAWREGANHDITVLRQYIPHAWGLADKHTQHFSGFSEAPIRLVDMALWVKRNSV